MEKGNFINVLPHVYKKLVIDGKFPVLEMNVNEVTYTGTVKAPPAAVTAYPIIEKITFSNDGWMKCSAEAGFLDQEAYNRLSAETMVKKLQDEKHLIHTEEDMLPSDIYTDSEMVEIMIKDPEKLYVWMRSILEWTPDQINARAWLSAEIKKFVSPAPLPANPVDSD